MILAVAIPQYLLGHGDPPLALEQSGASEGKVQQTDHVQTLQGQDPAGIYVKLARRIDASDHRTHGGTGDGADFVSILREPVDDSAVPKACGTAAAHHERNCTVGGRHGPVSGKLRPAARTITRLLSVET